MILRNSLKVRVMFYLTNPQEVILSSKNTRWKSKSYLLDWRGPRNAFSWVNSEWTEKSLLLLRWTWQMPSRYWDAETVLTKGWGVPSPTAQEAQGHGTRADDLKWGPHRRQAPKYGKIQACKGELLLSVIMMMRMRLQFFMPSMECWINSALFNLHVCVRICKWRCLWALGRRSDEPPATSPASVRGWGVWALLSQTLQSTQVA